MPLQLTLNFPKPLLKILKQPTNCQIDGWSWGPHDRGRDTLCVVDDTQVQCWAFTHQRSHWTGPYLRGIGGKI